MKHTPTIKLDEAQFNTLLAGFWIAGFVPPSPKAHKKILHVYDSDFGTAAVKFVLKKSNK